jgi:hypothetical protein
VQNGEIFLEELGSTVQVRYIDGHFKDGSGYNVKLAER